MRLDQYRETIEQAYKEFKRADKYHVREFSDPHLYKAKALLELALGNFRATEIDDEIAAEPRDAST